MSATGTKPERAGARPTTGLVVDSDVHPSFANGLNDLAPYMTAAWRSRLGISEDAAKGGVALGPSAPHVFPLPFNLLYVNRTVHLERGNARAMMVDAATETMAPGTDAAFTARQLFDDYGVDRAILVAGQMLSLGAITDPEIAVALARAYNEWMIERWLQVDARYRGCILATPTSPSAAVQEIDRHGERGDMAAVFLPLHDLAMGERHYWPIYEAAERHGLPLLTHPSGTENMFPRAPRLAINPTYFIEWHSLLGQVQHANTVSLICHGVFEQYPKLTVIMAEGGFGWAADTMWRLDRAWKTMRDDTPWLKRRPSEYMMDHIRFTTQPLPEPEVPQQLVEVLAMVHAERTLLYSSDYPHWDFDDPNRVLAHVPDEMRHRIMVETPRDVYGDRLN